MAYKQDIKVKYGDFTFPMPSPYVSKTYRNEMIGGDLWVTVVEVTLNGQIALLPDRAGDVEDVNSYAKLAEKRNDSYLSDSLHSADFIIFFILSQALLVIFIGLFIEQRIKTLKSI